jgi:hypothetical protein
MISRKFSTPHAIELNEEDPEKPKVFSEPQDKDFDAVLERSRLTTRGPQKEFQLVNDMTII